MTTTCPGVASATTAFGSLHRYSRARTLPARCLSKRSLIALVFVFAVGEPPAFAVTDWEIASRTWREQLAELYVADAVRRMCPIRTPSDVASTLRSTIAGLEQALGAGSKAAGTKAERLSEQGLVAEAGGRRKFCANSALVDQAKATLQAVTARVMASSANPASPAFTPMQATAASDPTPVIDPDVALIRGCRTAVLARTQSDPKRFWSQYERCVSNQGAGWYWVPSRSWLKLGVA